MDIKRFGPGFRKPDGPPGTQGVSGQVIFRDERAVVSELAFQRFAIITPHSNPTSTSIFVVISGAGFVQVGDERARINHGEAVEWPAGIPHGAYTDGTEMRAIIVELQAEPTAVNGAPTTSADPSTGEGPEATTRGPAASSAGERLPATRADGALAERQVKRDEYDSAEGEPW
ncbi:MAG: cupin domain-containing protein [Candidatus Limnocylindrales bacterium]